MYVRGSGGGCVVFGRWRIFVPFLRTRGRSGHAGGETHAGKNHGSSYAHTRVETGSRSSGCRRTNQKYWEARLCRWCTRLRETGVARASSCSFTPEGHSDEIPLGWKSGLAAEAARAREVGSLRLLQLCCERRSLRFVLRARR